MALRRRQNHEPLRRVKDECALLTFKKLACIINSMLMHSDKNNDHNTYGDVFTLFASLQRKTLYAG